MSVTDQPAQEQAPPVTEEDIEAQYPGLDIWQGHSGTWYARPHMPVAQGANPAQLLEAIGLLPAEMRDWWRPPPDGSP